MLQVAGLALLATRTTLLFRPVLHTLLLYPQEAQAQRHQLLLLALHIQRVAHPVARGLHHGLILMVVVTAVTAQSHVAVEVAAVLAATLEMAVTVKPTLAAAALLVLAVVVVVAQVRRNKAVAESAYLVKAQMVVLAVAEVLAAKTLEQ